MPALEPFADPHRVPSLLAEPASRAFSVVVVSAGWPADLERLAASLGRHCAGADYELVVVSIASPDLAAAAEALAAAGGPVRGLAFTQRVGWAAAANAGITQSAGTIVVLGLTSIEASGDFLTPLAGALADEAVGLVGPWGLRTADLRSFEECTEGPAHAVQWYCMAFRRADVARVGLIDPGYKFYRNADIDWSFQWLDHGFSLRTLNLSLWRHEHREWDELEASQRDRKSRDNFSRFLRRWRDRKDLAET
ncbi:MAG: glycosyltransferase family 2 protein [Actinomycetota bacterium]